MQLIKPSHPRAKHTRTTPWRKMRRTIRTLGILSLLQWGDPIKIGDLTTAHTRILQECILSQTRLSLRVKPPWLDDIAIFGGFTVFLENNPGIIIPPPPGETGRGSVRWGFRWGASPTALSTMLSKIAKHWGAPSETRISRIFLESETFTTDIKNKQVSDSKGIMSTIGEAFSFSSGKFIDTNDNRALNERKKRVDMLENQFRVLSKSLEQGCGQSSRIQWCNHRAGKRGSAYGRRQAFQLAERARS